MQIRILSFEFELARKLAYGNLKRRLSDCNIICVDVKTPLNKASNLYSKIVSPLCVSLPNLMAKEGNVRKPLKFEITTSEIITCRLEYRIKSPRNQKSKLQNKTHYGHFDFAEFQMRGMSRFKSQKSIIPKPRTQSKVRKIRIKDKCVCVLLHIPGFLIEPSLKSAM